LSSRSATSSDPRPHDTGVVDPRVGIVTGIEGGRGLWGLNIIGARCERKKSIFLTLRPSANGQIYPNPYNAGDPRVGIVSGRGGEWALGVKYDARTMRGTNDQVRWKKRDFFTSIVLVLMHEFEG
jgi:hypothetical protein